MILFPCTLLFFVLLSMSIAAPIQNDEPTVTPGSHTTPDKSSKG